MRELVEAVETDRAEGQASGDAGAGDYPVVAVEIIPGLVKSWSRHAWRERVSGVGRVSPRPEGWEGARRRGRFG